MRVCIVAVGIAVAACGALTGAPETSGPADAGGTDAASTYVLFEQAGYAAKTNNRFLQKGAHEGPALTPTQVNLFNAWLALEP